MGQKQLPIIYPPKANIIGFIEYNAYHRRRLFHCKPIMAFMEAGKYNYAIMIISIIVISKIMAQICEELRFPNGLIAIGLEKE